MKSKQQRTANFSKLLRRRLAELQMHPPMFQIALRMRRTSLVLSWLNGTALPPVQRVPDIVQVLDLCPAEAFLTWAGELVPDPMT
jgi:hypothetical protein